MTESQEQDPNLRWDGQRWLRWNGSAWTDATTGALIAGSGQPAPTGGKKGKGCLIGGLVALGAFVLLIVIVAIAGGGSNSGSNSNTANESCAGKTYPDKQPGDICADAAGTVTLDGVSVTAKPFTAKSDAFSGKALCSSVTIKNGTNETQDYNIFNFKVQTPSGTVDTTSTGNIHSTLGSGALVAGGTKTGLVCADDSNEKGQYVLIYDPSPFSDERGIWLMNG